jgi:hypothetical protein
MAFLEYLYINETRPFGADNRIMMAQLYDSSCKTCNRIKTNNLYIRSNNDGLGAMFEPNVYEIQKDVIAFFLDLCGSKKKTCAGNNQQGAIKKVGEDFYYNSIVTVTKEGRTTQYPNLILAILGEEERNTGKNPSNIKRRRGNNNTYEQSYGSLDDIFRNIENTFTIARIYDTTNDFNAIPASIEKKIPLRRGVAWIQGRYAQIVARVQGVCALLNDIGRRIQWNEKYTNALLNPPPFVYSISQAANPKRRTLRKVIAREDANTRRAAAAAEAAARAEESAERARKRTKRAANRAVVRNTSLRLDSLFNSEVEGQQDGGRRKTRKASKKTRRHK